MKQPPVPVAARLRRYLATGYALLILYASLSPFTGWRDQGLAFTDVLTSPLGLTYSTMDVLVNVLAYVPFGMLLTLALLGRLQPARGVVLAVLAGSGLSASMEYLQMYLPVRTSSNLDILTNSLGALAGALLATRLAPSPSFARLLRWRQSAFRRGRHADFGLALAVLWMFAQINPSLPMLGHMFITGAEPAPFQPAPAAPFGWLASAETALNLLMLGCLYFTLLRHRRHALAGVALTLSAVAVCKFVAAAALLKSWALLLWLNGEAMLGLAAGTALLVVAARAPQRIVLASAAAAALLYLGVGIGLLDGSVPPGLGRLYYWKEGHFLTYNGLSHVIQLLFPLLLLGYLWHARKGWRLPV